MNNFFDWKEEYTVPFICIMAVSIGFPTGWFLSYSEKIKSKFFKNPDTHKAWISYVVFQKLISALFMGVIPGIIVMSSSPLSLNDLGINFNNFSESLKCIAVIGSLILIINYFTTRSKANLEQYPQMRINNWGVREITLNSFAWFVYLLGYEFMNRGLLLTVCYHYFGFWPAVAINLCFYSATHIAKGLRETILTFPFGLLLCYVTVSTGSLAFAIITHFILAMSTDYYSVYHNPEMKFTK